ncbi:MFS transporter [Candidimonas nitroreducens]|uniref:MFS transporter n=1 Tax=Candidimonas nitroreducens TaxID=683354 RepID=A0A225M6G8_9BURK|nr:MFS transporter [Candidimonas nitroreducens]OWT56917.1 MFS transporter [Candidimonas nitroreducens]
MARVEHKGIYFGWAIVASATVLTLLTVGLRLSIGPFFLPMAHDLGLDRSELSSIVAVGMMVYGLSMPAVGQLVSTWGTRNVLLVGTVVVAASVAGTVLATSWVGLLLSFGVGLSVGLALASPVTFTPIISRWFIRQRGMALFSLSAGSMAGIAILTPVFTSAIDTLGWRETMAGFALLYALAAIPSALWVIREQAPENADLPGDIGDRPAAKNSTARSPQPVRSAPPAAAPLSLREAVHTAPFWQIVFGLFACGFSMNLLGTHGMPMLMDHGFSAHTSSFGIALIGLMAILSSLGLGKLSDVVQRRSILATIYIVRGLGFFGLVEAVSPWQLYGVAAIGGVVWAGSVALSSAILADVYGTRLVGVLYGLAYVSHQIGGTISSWLGGWAYEHFHTHLVAFGTAGALLFVAAAISLRLPRRGVAFVSATALAAH